MMINDQETFLGVDNKRVLVKFSYNNNRHFRYEIWNIDKYPSRIAAELVDGNYIRNMRSFVCDNDEIARDIFYGI